MKTLLFVEILVLSFICLYVYQSYHYVHLVKVIEITEAERLEVEKWNRVHGAYGYATVPGVGTYFERDGKICWAHKENKEAVNKWMQNKRLIDRLNKSK